MKFITWNASMRFRDKIDSIFPFNADILVIPECEAPEKWRGENQHKDIHQFLWFGDNLNKGIGIFNLNEDYSIKLHPSYNKDFRYIIPLIVTGKQSFLLFAVWSQLTKNKFDSYIDFIFASETLLKQIRNLEIGTYEEWINLSDHMPIFMDFNSELED